MNYDMKYPVRLNLRLDQELLTKDADFGHPINYDLKITRKGDGLETTYSMVPMSTPLSEEVQDAVENNTVNLRALLTGDNPFA